MSMMLLNNHSLFRSHFQYFTQPSISSFIKSFEIFKKQYFCSFVLHLVLLLLLDLDNFGLARGQGTARLASWGQTRRIRDCAR